MKTQDKFNRKWILETGIPIVKEYGGNLTLRALHYRLVAAGMTNSIRHYKRVVAAMAEARWSGDVEFDDFDDHERQLVGETKYQPTDVDSEFDAVSESIEFWMDNYFKNRWENQQYYVEVFIEKKALQGVFTAPCEQAGVALFPCKGYPSLTHLFLTMQRINEASSKYGKHPVILYFGDYDPSGEDIPRSIEENLIKMGCSDFTIERVALFREQVIEKELPPAPTKTTDSRSAAWDGLGQVELDAIEPRELAQMCRDAIEKYFNPDLYEALQDLQSEEKEEYKTRIKEFVKSIE